MTTNDPETTANDSEGFSGAKMLKNTFKFWKSVDVEWSYGGSKSAKIPYIYCNCSYVCPPTKMAPKTVEGSIVL